jgi:hypothetical protein
MKSSTIVEKHQLLSLKLQDAFQTLDFKFTSFLGSLI